MAKLHSNRLKMRYDFTTGGFGGLIQRILKFNMDMVQSLTLRIYDDALVAENHKIADETRRMVLPDTRTILPTNQFNKIKSAETGDWITGELKRVLNKRLTAILHKPDVERHTGEKAGTMKERAVKEFQKETKRIFENYTKIDKTFGVPKNVKGIATTALRTASNTSKNEYFGDLLKKNKDMEILKRWIHNARLSRNPRENHREVARHKPIKFNELFRIKMADGKTVETPHPHWKGLPLGEILNCNCELQYLVRRNVQTIKKL